MSDRYKAIHDFLEVQMDKVIAQTGAKGDAAADVLCTQFKQHHPELLAALKEMVPTAARVSPDMPEVRVQISESPNVMVQAMSSSSSSSSSSPPLYPDNVHVFPPIHSPSRMEDAFQPGSKIVEGHKDGEESKNSMSM